jgi:hypothetical protein
LISTIISARTLARNPEAITGVFPSDRTPLDESRRQNLASFG